MSHLIALKYSNALSSVLTCFIHEAFHEYLMSPEIIQLSVRVEIGEAFIGFDGIPDLQDIFLRADDGFIVQDGSDLCFRQSIAFNSEGGADGSDLVALAKGGLRLTEL